MKKFIFLHGFLGEGRDWQAVREQLGSEGVSVFETPSLFFPEPSESESLTERSLRASLLEGLSMEDTARAWVQALSKEPQDTEFVWVGYSLGGRLLAHALLAGLPASKAVFVSGGLGLPSAARTARVQADEAWARRFAEDDWGRVLDDWNRQTVLGQTSEPVRRERDFDRVRLAAALRAWSLGKQEDLRPRLKDIAMPTLWLAGARDAKYQGLLQEVAASAPSARVAIVPDAGHRIPWDAPIECARLIRAFL